MRGIRWTNEAVVGLAALTAAERRAIFDHLDYITQFPAMYPVRQRGRFFGRRYFVLKKRWLVYYKSEEQSILVFAIEPALARPR